MDKGLHFIFCVVTAVLLLRESSQTGAMRNDDAMIKPNDLRGPEENLPSLTVTTILEDPYVMVRSAELEGYCIDLLKALASMLHFSYKVKVVGDGKYGAISPSETGQG